ncbi:MAG: hypothetical protein LUC93_04055 [Planctomycetaceae bacterium]|nr:hypothetical protein [Planctomycetaceae bacterium]
MTYPIELRKRALAKNEEGLTQGEIAEELAVSKGWVNKVLQCYGTYGELFPPRKKTGRPSKLTEQDRELLRTWVNEAPNLTLAQFAAKMTAHIGVDITQWNIFTYFKAMGFSHKKRLCQASKTAQTFW